jgi:hypothetical protein
MSRRSGTAGLSGLSMGLSGDDMIDLSGNIDTVEQFGQRD